MNESLRQHATNLERLAREQGLDYFPVDFELVPPSFMTEIAVYGLPVRMPHWSFGVRYIHQLVQHRMGHSRLFEVVFPGNPGRAYLSETNSVEENTLVVAHVLGHADFAKNNDLFRRSQEQVGYRIVELAASRAHQIADFIAEYGEERVEAVLDVALSLEQHIDVNQPLRRAPYPEYPAESGDGAAPNEFSSRYHKLPGEKQRPAIRDRQRIAVPPHPEYDLLWFIAHYGDQLDDWERDIFLMVREESFYFYPVFACQIMNEGWASLWHAKLLREADFLPQALYLDAIKAHSDVVRPYADDKQIALAINPYHVGFTIWEKILKDKGIEAAREIMTQDDDFSFIRNHLTEELAEQMHLFQYRARKNGEVVVTDSDVNDLREDILAPKFNFGAPRVAATAIETDGTLILRHEHEVDGRGLDSKRSERVLEYIQRVWRRPVVLHTIDSEGEERVLHQPT